MLDRLRRPARGGKEVVQSHSTESFWVARVESRQLTIALPVIAAVFARLERSVVLISPGPSKAAGPRRPSTLRATCRYAS
jgi:hypothetical protein